MDAGGVHNAGIAVRRRRMGFWMEIVTLVIPGFNDSNEELRDRARFLAKVSPDTSSFDAPESSRIESWTDLTQMCNPNV